MKCPFESGIDWRPGWFLIGEVLNAQNNVAVSKYARLSKAVGILNIRRRLTVNRAGKELISGTLTQLDSDGFSPEV